MLVSEKVAEAILKNAGEKKITEAMSYAKKPAKKKKTWNTKKTPAEIAYEVMKGKEKK